MLNKKKKALSLAVAQASMAVALGAGAAEWIVDSEADSGSGTLRNAIASALSGDLITISTTDVSEIELESPLYVEGKALFIAAEVDGDGRPQVTITPDEDGFRLFNLTAPANDPNDPLPFVISGLELADADTSEIGGGAAIWAEDIALVLDKSVVTGNTAVGVGGGVAVHGGELCLQGSRLSDNTVVHESVSDGKYAIGGGAAVNGILTVIPALDLDEFGGPDPLSCLVSDAATDLFTYNSVSGDFLAAAEGASTPEDQPFMPSVISGNRADVDIGLEEEEELDGEKYAALGGGLAVLESNFFQQVSRLLDVDIDSGPDRCKYTSGDVQCTVIMGSQITENIATVDVEGNDVVPEASVASGGGIFLGSPGLDRGLLLNTKYSDFSENEVKVEGSSAMYGDIVVGGGIGALNSPFPAFAPFWVDEIFGEDTCPDDGKYCGNRVMLGATTVSQNRADLGARNPDGGGEVDLIAGAGVGVLNIFPEGLGVDKYDAAPGVMSFFSAVTENKLTHQATEDHFGAIGAGIALGTSITDLDPEFRVMPQWGKYFGFLSGNSDNTLTVEGAEEDDLYGNIGGGGLSAPTQFIIGKKPEFAIISDDDPEIKYGAPVNEALFTSPGGIADNRVEVDARGVDNIALTVGGGGAHSNGLYSAGGGLGVVISGNELDVRATTSSGSIKVGGGGLGFLPLPADLDVGLFSSWKYAAIRDNAITVTGGSNLEIDAGGGGLGLFSSALIDESGPEPRRFSLSNSEVSGNSVELTSTNVDSVAVGGGVYAENVTGVFEVCCDSGYKYIANIFNSTIAGNSTSISGNGESVAGSGLFMHIKYDDDDTGGILSSTIAGNTGTLNGAADGGQVVLEIDDAAEDGFMLANTLISGSTAQGTRDLYYYGADGTVDVYATSVFHGTGLANPGDFLAPSFADPADLDVLQFNGSFFAEEIFKYGFFAATSTIALLPDSDAIDPDDGGCLSAETLPFDQRGYPRDDGCSDLGAYERFAEADGDSLVDDAELGAPGTDPDILLDRGFFQPPYGIVLPSGDGNSDGIPDVDQDRVASFTSSTDSSWTLEVLNGPDLGDVMPQPGLTAGGFDLSLGGVSFTVLTGTDDRTVELALIAPAVPGSPLSLVKQVCHPDLLPIGPDEGWEVLDPTPEPFGPGRVRFVFELETDGNFDCNGDEPNLEDPIYVARNSPSTIPTLPAALYALLSGAVAVLGLFGLRSRRKKPDQ